MQSETKEMHGNVSSQALSPKSGRSSSNEHNLIDSFILCIESLIKRLYRDSQVMSKLPVMISMLINNPKVSFHGNSILSLYHVAFQLSMPRESPPDSPNNEKPQMQTVDNYINYLISKCDKWTSAPRRRTRTRFGSAETTEHKLFQSLVVTPKVQPSQISQTMTFLYEDSSDMMKSSIEQDPRMTSYDSDSCTAMIQKSLVLLVDQADLYIEKCKKLRQSLPPSISSYEFEKEVNANIPMFSVPRLDEKNLLLYSKSFKVNIINEKAASAGLFGWCYMCRSTADFYCKESRLPVCGKKCKENLLQFLSKILSLENVEEHALEESKLETTYDMYREDLLLLFRHIIESAKEQVNSVAPNYVALIGYIASITNIVDRCGLNVSQMTEFRELVSNDLIQFLGHLLLTFNSKCLKNTCHLLLSLFKRFRHFLKKELYVILDVIIVSTIRSATSAFYQKHYLLNLICNLLSQSDVMNDIFLNYDCYPGYGNTLGKIFTTLCRIA